jgi:hypothetical protein
MNIRALALVTLLVATPAFAADIDGKWSGPIDTPNGPVTVNYTFKADGGTLTGATLTPDGAAVPIKDGKITGNKVTFSLTLDFGGGPTEFAYSGELAAGALKLHSEFMGMPIEFTLKKS